MSEEEGVGAALAKDVLDELAKRPPKPSKLSRMDSADYLKRLSEINRNLAQQETVHAERKRKIEERAATKELKQQESASKWVERVCWRCKAKFKIRTDWARPPTMCRSCTKDIDQTHLPTGRDTSTPYKATTIVPGGAPGSGRRR